MGNLNPSRADKLFESDSDDGLIKIKDSSSKSAESNKISWSNAASIEANKSQSQKKWRCDICTFDNKPSLPYCKMCNSPKPINNVWLWQDDDAEYQPYSMDICKNIDKLQIDDIYTTTISNIRYEIKKVAQDTCIQTNLKTNDVKIVILQNENENEIKDQEYDDKKHDNNNDLSYQWYWQHDNQSYRPFHYNDSNKLDALNVGDVYIMYIGGTKYHVTKISKDQCKQRNTKTNHERNVIRKSKDNYNQLQLCEYIKVM